MELVAKWKVPVQVVCLPEHALMSWDHAASFWSMGNSGDLVQLMLKDCHPNTLSKFCLAQMKGPVRPNVEVVYLVGPYDAYDEIYDLEAFTTFVLAKAPNTKRVILDSLLLSAKGQRNLLELLTDLEHLIVFASSRVSVVGKSSEAALQEITWNCNVLDKFVITLNGGRHFIPLVRDTYALCKEDVKRHIIAGYNMFYEAAKVEANFVSTGWIDCYGAGFGRMYKKVQGDLCELSLFAVTTDER